ncbi:MAG: ABC transporter permease [Planctomycetota bacterium]
MRNVLPICRREFSTYFLSPLGYIVLTIFLAVSGVFFLINTNYALQYDLDISMKNTFGVVAIIMLFASPLVSMRLLAEEKRSGTIEPLMTAPVTDSEVVIGKYLAALGFHAFLLLPTLVYVWILGQIGGPDPGPIKTGYAGLMCLSAYFLAIGMFASSLTRNQIVAAILAFVVLLVMWITGEVASGMMKEGSILRQVLEYAGTSEHFNSFVEGVIDTKDVVYFASVSVFFLFLTTKVVEARKWK